ncbi:MULTISPECIES: hypothetical protein [unclassified Streptomyces]|uniref:hypothetical protein n=1 Tax=unclassified Streptomyces TaxID=2593676 RepID=UPI002E36BD39|nr:hypothetical protein [Streptomyces sp. NBC_01268]
MEQSTGPSSIPPLQGAAADPAFVPGITGPRPDAAAVTAVSDEADAAIEPDEADAPDAAGGTDEADAVVEDAVPEEGGADADAAPEGPVFEAADRRARIVADGAGVRLSLDEESCDFRWDEIGAVETASGRFGKRFTVTVHTPDRRWYPIEIDAPARGHITEWESQLDAVLDAYFDENA